MRKSKDRRLIIYTKKKQYISELLVLNVGDCVKWELERERERGKEEIVSNKVYSNKWIICVEEGHFFLIIYIIVKKQIKWLDVNVLQIKQIKQNLLWRGRYEMSLSEVKKKSFSLFIKLVT